MRVVQVHVVKIALLYNPKSGAKKGEKLAHQAVKLFNKRGVDVELFPLQRKGHAKDICKVLTFLMTHLDYSSTNSPMATPILITFFRNIPVPPHPCTDVVC